MSDRVEKLRAKLQEKKFLLLLLAIIGMIFAGVVLDPEAGEQRWMGLLWAVVLAMALNAASTSRKITWIALALGLPGIVARIATIAAADQVSDATLRTAVLTSNVLAVLFLGFVIWVILSAVWRTGRITTDKIYGAVCVYLLLGIVWSSFYMIAEIVEPGSYRLPEQRESSAEAETVEASLIRAERLFGYYSFVTLTTLGYGDVTPVSHRARTLAWTEAVLGQLFIAITIARLVALGISHEQEESSSD